MADTIRILVATDNHVGAHERDPVRCDDSWRAFHEIMCLAKEREVDMILLAGDLFHENVPSRKSLYKVMQSIRMNCLGPKPCELEMLSDDSELFDAYFDHVNYEDPDINVSIPLFSIHGNHDDPSGEGHFAALDILAVSGLVNYFGRASTSDNINVKPLLIQKGGTKLALYGLSNVRDERLFHTFREGKVKFYQPRTQTKDWFQMICVHQNHVAHTETSYLPENFLPQFLDFVIWGHEHDCKIEPQFNPEMNFHVMQPGSSIATSLSPGEALPKHVSVLSITGREFKNEPIRLKSVRPFIWRDVVLAEDKAAVKIGRQDNHRTKLTQHLIEIVEDMVREGKSQWRKAHPEVENEVADQDLNDEEKKARQKERAPLIRLRVEITMPSGLEKFEVENPQRFSHRFHERVANTTDVIQFYSKKRAVQTTRQIKDAETDKAVMAKLAEVENIKVEKLVKEFLEAQSLTILPQNLFGESVTQYVDKDDKHAMENFVTESLANQIKELVRIQGENDDDDEPDEDELVARITEVREQMEAQFTKGNFKIKKNKARMKPKPETWDSDFDGHWEDQPAALIRSDGEDEDDDGSEDGTPAPATKSTRGKGRGGRAARGTTSTRSRGARGGRATATTSRSRKKVVPEESEEEDEDIVMIDDDESDSQDMFFASNNKKSTQPTTRSNGTAKCTRGAKKASPVKKTPARAAATKAKQSTLGFTKSQESVLGGGSRRSRGSVSDDIEDPSDDDFEDAPTTARKGRR